MVDPLDREILEYLQRHGRASPLDVADHTDAVATTVQKRLKALEEDGVVTGYEPRLDYGSLGFPVTALLHLSVRDGAVRAFTARVRGDDRLVGVYELTGEYNVLLVGKYPDTATMNDHLSETVTDPAVRTGRSSVVSRIVREYGPLRQDDPDDER